MKSRYDHTKDTLQEAIGVTEDELDELASKAAKLAAEHNSVAIEKGITWIGERFSKRDPSEQMLFASLLFMFIGRGQEIQKMQAIHEAITAAKESATVLNTNEETAQEMFNEMRLLVEENGGHMYDTESGPAMMVKFDSPEKKAEFELKIKDIQKKYTSSEPKQPGFFMGPKADA